MLVDTHAHLDFPQFDADRADCITRAAAKEVGLIINIGSSLKGSRQSVDLAQTYPSVYAAVGIHPHEADTFSGADADTLKKLAGNPKVVAIGEIGLDYFKNFSKPEAQRVMFRKLLALAKECAKPVVLHCRDAQEDVLSIMKECTPRKAVVHCFSGDGAFLRECLDAGWFISFTCNITYKKAEGLRAAVAAAPLERIMLETDAPYLSPEGFRGMRNEPMQVALLADYVAKLKKVTIEQVAEATTANAKSFFAL